MIRQVPNLLIVDAERYPDGAQVDLYVRDGVIANVGRGLSRARGDRVLHARGGALLPGLHDHHLHLLALAAARTSVQCGPPHVIRANDLARALRVHEGRGWLRGVGYHEVVAGELDRWKLDALVPDRPVRIQHASGKVWFLNSAAAELLALDRQTTLEGVERDDQGRPTGRLFRLDGWLRERLAATDPPELASTSRALAAHGVTGITDTSPDNDPATAALLLGAQAEGALLQRVRLMGGERLSGQPGSDRLEVGELKILLDEDRLPDLDRLVARVRAAHEAGRRVAFHCVSRVELVYALHALDAARAGRYCRVAESGAVPSDRIEHASVTPPDLFPILRELGVTVVTQPGFIAERGDRYLVEAESDERPHLYRLRSFIDAGIGLGLSSDAPYGAFDPWAAMRAARDRLTQGGQVVGAGEALSPEAALGGFLSRADAPGGAPREVIAGQPADLCLLDRPWRAAREALSANAARLTIAGGRPIPGPAASGGDESLSD